VLPVIIKFPRRSNIAVEIGSSAASDLLPIGASLVSCPVSKFLTTGDEQTLEFRRIR